MKNRVLGLVIVSISVCSGIYAAKMSDGIQSSYNHAFGNFDNLFAQPLRDINYWYNFCKAKANDIRAEAKKKHLGFITSDTNAQIMDALVVFERENANFTNALQILWKYCFSNSGRMTTAQLSQAQSIIRDLRVSKNNLENVMRSGVLAEITRKKGGVQAESAYIVEKMILTLIKGVDKAINDCRELMNQRK